MPTKDEQEQIVKVLELEIKSDQDADDTGSEWISVLEFSNSGWNFLDYQIPVLYGTVCRLLERLEFPRSSNPLPIVPRNKTILYLVTSEKMPDDYNTPYYKIYYGPPNNQGIHLVAVGHTYLNRERSIRQCGVAQQKPVYVSRFVVDVIQETQVSG